MIIALFQLSLHISMVKNAIVQLICSGKQPQKRIMLASMWSAALFVVMFLQAGNQFSLFVEQVTQQLFVIMLIQMKRYNQELHINIV